MSGRGLLTLIALAAATSCAAADGPLRGAGSVERLVAAVDDPAMTRSWKYIVLHHTATASGSVESIDAAHRQRLDADGNPWRGIGYHFVIGNGDGLADGEVAATFRWREQCDGAHAGVSQFNELGIGVCLVGDFQSAEPTTAQLAALRRLIDVLRREYGIDETAVLAHRDLKPTACPGERFPLADFRSPQAVIQVQGRAGD